MEQDCIASIAVHNVISDISCNFVQYHLVKLQFGLKDVVFRPLELFFAPHFLRILVMTL